MTVEEFEKLPFSLVPDWKLADFRKVNCVSPNILLTAWECKEYGIEVVRRMQMGADGMYRAAKYWYRWGKRERMTPSEFAKVLKDIAWVPDMVFRRCGVMSYRLKIFRS